MKADSAAGRIQSVDTFRVIAIFAVILIHTEPYSGAATPSGLPYLGVVINQLARFSVPYFFIISGFFWGSKLTNSSQLEESTNRTIRRILIIFIAWSIIYLMPTTYFNWQKIESIDAASILLNKLKYLSRSPWVAMLEGTREHLWFLSSLISCLVISTIFIRLQLQRSLIILAIVLYTIGLAGKAYTDTPLGFHSNFNYRDGPFFGLLFFITGYLLNQKKPASSWLFLGITVTIIGFLVHFLELFVLQHYWKTSMYQDYVFGTYFSGLGVALIALSGSPSLRLPGLSSLGPLVLGIYVVHIMFIDLLGPVKELIPIGSMRELGFPLIVFIFSAVTVSALSFGRLTRKIVA